MCNQTNCVTLRCVVTSWAWVACAWCRPDMECAQETRMGFTQSVQNKTPPIWELKPGKRQQIQQIINILAAVVMGLDYKGLISIHGVFKCSELVTLSDCLRCDHSVSRCWCWSPSWWRGWAGSPQPSPSEPGTLSGWASWPPGPGWSSSPPSSPASSWTPPWPGHWWATNDK